MKGKSILNGYLMPNKSLCNIISPNSRFFSTNTKSLNTLTYLNWLSQPEKTGYFLKNDYKNSLEPVKSDSFSHFVENYRKKVAELRSKILQAESLYTPNSDHSPGVDYEIIGNYAYYLKHFGDSYSLHRKRLPTLRGLKKELDQNFLITNGGEHLLDFSSLSNRGINNIKRLNISPNGQVISLLYDPDLSDNYMASFYSIPHRKFLPSNFENVGEIHFMPFHKSHNFSRVYYTQLNSQKRACKLLTSLLHLKSGTITNTRALFNDPVNFISLFKSKNGQALFVASTSYNKVLSAFLINPYAKMYSLPLLKTTKLFLEYNNRTVYCIYSDLASHISKVPIHHLKPLSNHHVYDKNYYEKTLTKLDYVVTDIDMFKSSLLLYLLTPPSAPKLGVLKFPPLKKNQNRPDENILMVDLPTNAGSIEPSSNTNYHSNLSKFTINAPGSWGVNCELDLATCGLKALNNLDASIKTFVVHAPTRDGSCKVPITLVCKDEQLSDLSEISSRKTILYVYGFYGETLALTNYMEHIPLLHMGYLLCFAHVRGGGELGESWQKMGTKTNKQNSFYDLVDAIQFLIAKGITSRNQLALSVSSASGILGGCLYNMRPDLCSVITFKLPFLDLFATFNDSSQPLVEMEYEEFGNSTKEGSNQEVLDTVYSLDPCINAKTDPVHRPSLIINCNENDIRAPWHHTAKFLQLITQKHNKDNIFVKVANYGHHGLPPYHHLVATSSEEVSIIDHFLSQNSHPHT